MKNTAIVFVIIASVLCIVASALVIVNQINSGFFSPLNTTENIESQEVLTWKYKSKENWITGEVTNYLVAEPIEQQFSDVSFDMEIKCLKPGISMILRFPDEYELSSGSKATVTYRFPNNDWEGSILWDGYKNILWKRIEEVISKQANYVVLLKTMYSSDETVMQIDIRDGEYDEVLVEYVQAKFDMSGFREGIDRLSEECPVINDIVSR